MVKLKEPDQFCSFPGYGAVTFGHVSILSLLHGGIICESYIRRAFTFTITRNPYTRSVSLYNYLCKTGEYTGSFDDFLDFVRFHRPPIGLYNQVGLSQANCQVDWIVNDEGGFIVDSLYKVEELSTLVSDFSTRFGIALDAKKKRNVTKKQENLIRFLDVNNRAQKILAIYDRDFKLLDYSKRVEDATDS